MRLKLKRQIGLNKVLIIIYCLLSISTHGQNTFRALFLGNSYTSVNNLPQIISDIAYNMSDTLIYDSYTPGGYTLNQHRFDSISTNKIQNGGWDFVILQDQSQVPAFPWYNGIDAAHLCYLTNQYNPCAHSMFYLTWGRENGDSSNCDNIPPMCTYSGMDSLLHLSYMDMAMSNSAELSPVGAVWKHIRQNHPSLELYQPDGSHPSNLGSYVAACSFYTALFKKDPTQITYDYTIGTTEANIIRNATKIIVFDSLSQWDYVKHYPPTADFNYTIGLGNNEAIFHNYSSYDSDTYLWDFGDGSTSTDRYPTPHSYLSDGTYTITLTVTYCDLSITYQAQHQENITFCSYNPTISPDNLSLCSGSTDTLWTQLYDSYQWLDFNGDSIPNQNNQYIIASGNESYAVLVNDNNCSEISPHVSVIEIDVWHMLFDSCQTVGVPEYKLEPTIIVYPNPSSEELFIDGLTKEGSNRYSVLDTQGRLIRKNELMDLSINISELQTGVYFVIIETADSSSVLKFIKE